MHGVRVWLQGPALMARQRGRRADATDLTDTQGARIALLIREAGPGGRSRKARRGSWSTPSSPFCAPGWQGGFSRTISRPGRRSTTPSGAGSVKACGIASPTPCSWLSASEPGVRRARPLRSSTARPCDRQIKKGIEGLRCGQDGQRPQAPHPDRYRRAAARHPGAGGRHPGPGRSQRRPEALARALPFC